MIKIKDIGDCNFNLHEILEIGTPKCKFWGKFFIFGLQMGSASLYVAIYTAL